MMRDMANRSQIPWMTAIVLLLFAAFGDIRGDTHLFLGYINYFR